MLAGFHEWDKQGLNPPEAVTSATEEYRQDSDTVSRFIEDKCETSPEYESTASEVYDAYRRWIDESGETFTCTAKQLKDSLESRSEIKHKRTEVARMWVGLRLRRGVSGPAPQAEKEMEMEELPF